MENKDINNEQQELWRQWEKQRQRGKVAGGILIVIIGSLFLARELGAELPYWLFSWKALLIGIGFVFGFKHGFRRAGWLIPVIIGSVFLVSDMNPTLILKSLLIPILIIAAGLFMIFKPRRSHRHWRRHKQWHKYRHEYCHTAGGSEDYIEANCVFGTVKKNIISKDFKGGEINVVFGGAEVNLSQADITDKATLEVNLVFGGTTLIIPANWEIKSELTSVLGSIEDKRPVQPGAGTTNKILILRGSTVCGGIDIKSY